MINLHTSKPEGLDAETVEVLTSFGAQISEIVANTWYQIKLREKEAARQLLLEVSCPCPGG